MNPTNQTPLSHEIIHKELDLIQDVIKRMAENSFKVKAWAIGIVAAIIAFEKEALFAFGSDETSLSIKILLNLLLALPVICFWYLDGFFLNTESLYRSLYKWAVANRPETNEYLYDLNTWKRTVNGQTEEIKSKFNSVKDAMFSKTLKPFYIMPLVFIAGLLIYNIGISLLP